MDYLERCEKIHDIFGANYRKLKIPYNLYLEGKERMAIKALENLSFSFSDRLQDEVNELIELLKN